MVDTHITSKSEFARHVDMERHHAFANSVGAREIEAWARTRSEDVTPEMAKSLLNQERTIPDVWHHWSRRAPRHSSWKNPL